ncbi:thioredoxin AAED1 [Brachionus plicatilis]|uniref:Thioredoxin AAED1 n=1 Tax=Brachionus plicatilis TaxID=10195 RepID=A0A3M7SIK6_BRAPC|nr:thioredoxin AAED1 [Brachionus plicatilis]
MEENKKFFEQKAAVPPSQFIINLDGDEPKLTTSRLKEIGECFVYDEVGNRHTMSELWSEFRTIFVFVRSFLCFTTKEYVEDLALVPRQNLKQAQVRLVLIGCAHWKHIREFKKLTNYPYMVFCDTDYDVYNRLGFQKNKEIGRPGDSPHVKSSSIGGFFSSLYRAVTSSSKFDYQGNFDQQGGSLILSPDLTVHYFHADKTARDHTPINTLLSIAGVKKILFSHDTGSQSKVLNY